MGIQIEFNPDLALRNISEYKKGARKKEECAPSPMLEGNVYSFLKAGQRNYWFDGEIPLLETKGNAELSRPKASIVILKATHFNQDGKTWTKGKYKVMEVFNDGKIYFESYKKI